MSYSKENAINTLVTKGFIPFKDDVEVVTKFIEILEVLVSCDPGQDRPDNYNNMLESFYYNFLSGMVDEFTTNCQAGLEAIDSVVSLLLTIEDDRYLLEGLFSSKTKEFILNAHEILNILTSNKKDKLYAIIEIHGKYSDYRAVFFEYGKCVKTFAYIGSHLYDNELFIGIVEELLLSTLENSAKLHTYDTEVEFLVALQTSVNSTSSPPISIAIPKN